jgi:hypothetical protein
MEWRNTVRLLNRLLSVGFAGGTIAGGEHLAAASPSASAAAGMALGERSSPTKGW